MAVPYGIIMISRPFGKELHGYSSLYSMQSRMHDTPRRLAPFIFGLLLGPLAGCDTLFYIGQAAKGHLGLLGASKKVVNILEDSQAESALKVDLQQALAILDFAESHLALARGKNYRRYVALSERHVVWNVFVAPEFNITPVRWCFPIAGCVPYRGYFNKQQAVRYADKQIRRGLDTYVGGIKGYSTLGWLADPLLSSFFQGSDIQLAALLFHELAHSLLYVAGDSAFNEGFATVVEQAGLCRWLLTQGRVDEFRVWHKQASSSIQFARFVDRFRQQLAALYASSEDAETLRAHKAFIFTDMQRDYWASPMAGSKYDAFMNGNLNNASLNTIAIYRDQAGSLWRLLAQQNYDLPAFYATVRELAKEGKQARYVRLRELRPLSTKGDDADRGDDCGADQI